MYFIISILLFKGKLMIKTKLYNIIKAEQGKMGNN